MNLKEIRDEIDKIDDDILELFLKRMALSDEVAKIKKDTGKMIKDDNREKQIIKRLTGKSTDNSYYIKSLFSHIMGLSRERQQEK